MHFLDFIYVLVPLFVIPVRGEPTVRLVDGPSPLNGRLEVYHGGQWGNVCDDNFNVHAAVVVCRQLLGRRITDDHHFSATIYNYHNNTGFRNNANFLLDDVECRGNEESIEDCKHNTWGRHDCKISEVAGVICDVPMYAVINEDRFIEVINDTEKYSICSDDFDERLGQVVCARQGYKYGEMFAKELPSQESNNTFLPFELVCKGNETSLEDCIQTNKNKLCPVGTAARLRCFNETVEEAISVSCSNNSFDVRVDLNKLSVFYPGLDVNDLLLGGECNGRLEDNDTLVFDQNFASCSTKSQEITSDILLLTNHLVHLVVSPSGIIRQFLWAVDLECRIARNDSVDISFVPIESNHVHHVGNSSHLSPVVNLYSDPLFEHKLSESSMEVLVGKEVFVQVKSSHVSGVRMVVENCYGKPDLLAEKSQSFILIENGCERDTDTHITRYSDTETRFFFTAFEFQAHQKIVDVHCDVRFCKTSATSTCRHGCHGSPGIIG